MAAVEVRPGIAIAYERSGSGPPLVLVHGITESRRSWDPLVPLLAEHFDVVAADLRGHGESTKAVWPDHGHYPHLLDPERFLARVTEFAARA